MKKLFSIILIIATIFTLSSCSEYVSSYSAIMMVRSSRNNSCSLSFQSLDGRVVLNTKKTEENELDTIHYTASLGEGEINVYYAPKGEEKTLLFSINSGGQLEGRAGEIELSEKIYIIIETVGKAHDGKIEIDFK